MAGGGATGQRGAAWNERWECRTGAGSRAARDPTAVTILAAPDREGKDVAAGCVAYRWPPSDSQLETLSSVRLRTMAVRPTGAAAAALRKASLRLIPPSPAPTHQGGGA